MVKTYTLAADYVRLGRAGDTVSLDEKAAQYLVMSGILVEQTAKTKKG